MQMLHTASCWFGMFRREELLGGEGGGGEVQLAWPMQFRCTYGLEDLIGGYFKLCGDI